MFVQDLEADVKHHLIHRLADLLESYGAPAGTTGLRALNPLATNPAISGQAAERTYIVLLSSRRRNSYGSWG